MKKVFSLVLALAMFLSLCACGRSYSSSSSSSGSSSGFVGSDGKYHSQPSSFGSDVNNWMKDNW